ncbi:MAG: DUF1285 domain-containing protein [Alphaproteobacteria bacterium]
MSDQPPRAPHGPGKSSDSGERLYHLRIDRDGVWHHEGRPIARKPLVKLFASVLRREADGDYWLVTPVERGRIEVEDVPFVVIDLIANGSGQDQTLRVKSNLDEWVAIDQDHPLRLHCPTWASAADADSAPLPSASTPVDLPSSNPLPYVEIRPGLEGRLLRPVYYELVELGDSHPVDGTLRYGVWSAGRFFPLD